METLYDILMTVQTEETHDVKTKEGRKQL